MDKTQKTMTSTRWQWRIGQHLLWRAKRAKHIARHALLLLRKKNCERNVVPSRLSLPLRQREGVLIHGQDKTARRAPCP